MIVIDSQQTALTSVGFPEGSTVIELSLLLETTLLERLEGVAEEQGVAAANLIRCLLRAYVHQLAVGERTPY